MFQDDKDLVHEFVSNDGLECLIKVGMEADQKYQNYILRGEISSCPANPGSETYLMGRERITRYSVSVLGK